MTRCPDAGRAVRPSMAPPTIEIPGQKTAKPGVQPVQNVLSKVILLLIAASAPHVLHGATATRAQDGAHKTPEPGPRRKVMKACR